MKVVEIILETTESLNEAREAPLYHFTNDRNLLRILAGNSLVGRGGRIYFTRDYDRQFLPHEDDLMSGTSWGLRIDQSRLRQKYGRRLMPGGQDRGWSTKKSAEWLADPENQREVELVRATGRGSGVTKAGAPDAHDIVKGNVNLTARWESEEHLLTDQLPNLHEYLTGIVVGTGFDKYGHGRMNPNLSPVEELAEVFIGRYSKPDKWKFRDWLIDAAEKLNVPFVYKRQDVPAGQLRKTIFEILKKRKAEREHEATLPPKVYEIIVEPGGTTGRVGPSLAKALERSTFPVNQKILGYKNETDDTGEMFDRPMSQDEAIKWAQANNR